MVKVKILKSNSNHGESPSQNLLTQKQGLEVDFADEPVDPNIFADPDVDSDNREMLKKLQKNQKKKNILWTWIGTRNKTGLRDSGLELS